MTDTDARIAAERERKSPGLEPEARSEGPEREFTVESKSQMQLVVRRFFHHRLAMASLLVLVILILFALVGGRLWKYTYSEITPEFSTAPDLTHPMGTDTEGHDFMALILRGAQKSVQVMLIVAFLSTAIGVVVGAISGYFRGWVDAVIMRFLDLMFTVPLIAVLAVLSNGWSGNNRPPWVPESSGMRVALILGLLIWPTLARLVRAEFLSLREKEFVEAARAMGAGSLRIIFRHILPNTVGTIIVSATLTMAAAILLETALSFLGFGIQAPDTSLGLLVSRYQTAAVTRPWLFYFPGVFIVIIALCVNFLGDGLRDAFDPKQTRVRQ
ncbi:MAG: ABC transporter permease [Acidimicrobiales bacterium]